MARVNILEWIAKKLRSLTGIVEDGDTATHAISAGKYVIWKGNPCKASSAISIGDALSSSNLTPLTDGVCNDLANETGAKVNKTDIVNNLITNDSTKVLSAAQGYALNNNINKLLVGTTISGVDLNDYKETGLYIVNGNITHSPTGNYGFMFVVKEPGSIARQIYFPQGSNGMYLRRLYEGTWQSWYSVTITQVT